MRSAALLKQPKVELLAVLSLAILSLFLQYLLRPSLISGPDIHPYVAIANSISEQPDFWSRPDAFEGNFWAMAYPTFLHVIFVFTNNSLQAVQIIQMLIGASLVFGSWFIVRHLGLAVRLIAAILVTLTPVVWSMSANIGYEIILAWLLLASLALAWGYGGKDVLKNHKLSILSGVLSGAFIGLAVLTQTKTLAVIPVIAFILIKQSRMRLWSGVVGFALALVPWMIRNLLVLGTPNPLTNNGPYNIWVGNNPLNPSGGSMLIAPPLPSGSTYTSAALQFIVNQPEIALGMVFHKASRLLEPIFVYPNILGPGPAQTLLHIYSALFGLLGIIGVAVFLGARLFAKPPTLPSITPIVCFVVFFYLIHIPFIAEPRFLAPLAPIDLAITSAVAVFAYRRFRMKQV